MLEIEQRTKQSKFLIEWNLFSSDRLGNKPIESNYAVAIDALGNKVEYE